MVADVRDSPGYDPVDIGIEQNCVVITIGKKQYRRAYLSSLEAIHISKKLEKFANILLREKRKI